MYDVYRSTESSSIKHLVVCASIRYLTLHECMFVFQNFIQSQFPASKEIATTLTQCKKNNSQEFIACKGTSTICTSG